MTEFDAKKVREICSLAEPRISRARSMILGYLAEHPMMTEDRIESVIDAAEQLSSTLVRIEELERRTYVAMRVGDSNLFVYGSDEATGKMRDEIYSRQKRISELEQALIAERADSIDSTDTKSAETIAREQLEKEGIL